MFESLASCFAFRCSASLNSPQDESAVADTTGNDFRLLGPLLAIDATGSAESAPPYRPIDPSRQFGLRPRRLMRWLLTNRYPNRLGNRHRLLTTRIDHSELRLNHFVGKLSKSSRGLPAKSFANLIRATDEPGWFCRPIKRRIMLHIFLPWRVNNSESRLDKFAHRM
jgi:hypothetical protein